MRKSTSLSLEYYEYQISGWRLFIACSAIICNNVDDFDYSRQVEDLWRLLLIKPYELKNLRNADSTERMTAGWELEFNQKNEFGGNLFSRIKNINIKRGIIYGYGKGLVTYFAIDTRINKEYFFDDKNEWNSYLNKHLIDTSSLLSAWNTFYEFHTNATLPWKDEIPPA